MNGLGSALWGEALKARRSRMPWITALGGSLAPLIGGLFMVILKDPVWARRNGLIAAKAQLAAGTADWSTYWALLAQAVAVGGLVLFGLIAIWVFGREHSDRTAKDLLALPTARSTILGAKFVVVAVWSTLIAALISLEGLGVGAAVGLPGWSSGLMLDAARQIAVTAGLTVALVTPLAWAASAGRGYLPPVGMLFLALVLAQILAAAGWGGMFPWSVPALMSGIAGPVSAQVGMGSYLLVVLVGVAGVGGTLMWWQRADHV
jgi:ABC-2 type transport system permease protein